MNKLQYVNQVKQIKNGTIYCGAACVAMITGEEPQAVADAIGGTADDMKLLRHIEGCGYVTYKIVDGGSAKTGWGFIPKSADLDKVRSELDGDNIILYHFAGWDGRSAGHYAICVGYNDEGFIFYDPAGDRTKGYFNDDGQGAVYTESQLKYAGIKRLFAIYGAKA